MGVIKDGSISGVLPSSKLFAVHYPGYPSSTERALETLGGIDGIVKARSSQSNKLELHFRPEDPYSHPAVGKLYTSNNFLLRISKKEDGGCQSSSDAINQDQKISCPESLETDHVIQPESKSVAASSDVEVQIPNEVQGNLYADVIAQVPESYHFNGMVDYQHVLAVHADVARRKKRNWSDVEPHFEKGGLMDVDQEDLMILVPPLFSPKDIPEKIVLKSSTDVSLKKKREGVARNRWEMEIEPCLAIDFYIEEVPKKVDWEKYIPKGSAQWEWQMTVCNLFDERPIWKRDSIDERLHDKGLLIGYYNTRRLLSRAAYYFSNGPFLKFWIRKGYDPRKDPESRIYQRIDFRIQPQLRSYCDANVGLKHRWSDICSFCYFPYKCQNSLQLFDLADEYIQQEISKTPTEPTCSLNTGWFSARVLATLRLRIRVRFLEVYPKDDAQTSVAQTLLKEAIKQFEKSKKLQFFVKDLRPDDGQQEINKEHVGNEEKELNDEEEDEAEEDEEEEEDEDDDEIEEELAAYEDLDLVGEDGDLSSQPHTDQGNVSKNYLQELFGSLPFSDAGGGFELPDVANSDEEEYQIYEHYSDGNLSGDDDY